MGGLLEPTTGFNRADKTKLFVPSGNRTPTARLQIMSYLECDWRTIIVTTNNTQRVQKCRNSRQDFENSQFILRIPNQIERLTSQVMFRK